MLNTRQTQRKFTNSTSKHGQAVNTPDFYLGGSAFESRPGDYQLLPGVLMVFFSHSRWTPELCLKIHNYHVLACVRFRGHQCCSRGFESSWIWQCYWVSGYWCCRGTQCLYPNRRMYTWIFQPLNVKAIRSFKMLETSDPATLSHPRIPKLFVCSFYHFIIWHYIIRTVPSCHVPQQAMKHLFC